MKVEAINFFESKKIPISLMIDHRRRGLTPGQVEEAALITYQEIKDGLEISDNKIPKYVFAKARTLQGKQYKKDQVKLINYDEKVESVAKAYKKARTELKALRSSIEARKVTWMRLLFISGWGTILIYVALKLLELDCRYEIF